MDKYTQYLDEIERPTLLEEMFNLVKDRKFEEAYGVSMKIDAVKDIKWRLKKLDDGN